MDLILFTFNSNLQARTRKKNSLSLSLSELRGVEEEKGKGFENNG
jgi:hypothetical protein